MFGLILYELSVGERPLEDVIPLSILILSLYHQRSVLNIEAAITHKCKQQLHSKVGGRDGCVKACHVLCLQTIINLCTMVGDVTIDMIRARLSLCAGEEAWGPLKMTLDIECLLANKDSSLVYWASGSRGLVVGTIHPITGELYRHILAEAPTPESGLFANRRGKPIPIAVGHATAIDVCFATNQLWVGTENGLMGSVYVFDLPDMKSHHYIHLQDAVLSLKVVNDQVQLTDQAVHQYHVLVGLANGTIILFMGRAGGQPLKNPLQGPRKVIMTTDRKPCLSIQMTSNGHFWCGCGSTIEVIESTTLRSLLRHQCLVEEKDGAGTTKLKGDVIVLMGINSRGVWSVTRRSTVLRLWDSITGNLKASFNIRYVNNYSNLLYQISFVNTIKSFIYYQLSVLIVDNNR